MLTTHKLHTSLLNTDFVKYTIILPSDPQKTCLWLHGRKERAEDILNNSNLEHLAEKYHTAILLPDVPDTYYLDQPWKNCFTEQFLITEFLPKITERYALPCQPQQLIIAGISMGGFGSLLLGSHHPDLFSRIICISGAFIIDDILIGNPEVVGAQPESLNYFRNLFGDIPSLDASEGRNPLNAALKTLSAAALPRTFLSCGKSDLLYSRNIHIKNRLITAGADITWREYFGDHTWDIFSPAIADAFSWMAAK